MTPVAEQVIECAARLGKIGDVFIADCAILGLYRRDVIMTAGRFLSGNDDARREMLGLSARELLAAKCAIDSATHEADAQ